MTITDEAFNLIGGKILNPGKVFDLPANDIWKEQFRDWIRNANIKKEVSIHSCRSVFTKIMIKNGATQEEITAILGHKNVNINDVVAACKRRQRKNINDTDMAKNTDTEDKMAGEEKKHVEEMGKLLASMRESCGLTQEDVFNIIGMTQSQLSNIERGRNVLRLNTLEKLVDLYGYEVKFVRKEDDDIKEQG